MRVMLDEDEDEEAGGKVPVPGENPELGRLMKFMRDGSGF